MGVVVHYFSQHLDAVLSFQVEQGADDKCEDVDCRPQGPELLDQSADLEQFDGSQRGADSSECNYDEESEQGQSESADGVFELRSSFGLGMTFDDGAGEDEGGHADIGVVDEIGCEGRAGGSCEDGVFETLKVFHIVILIRKNQVDICHCFI